MPRLPRRFASLSEQRARARAGVEYEARRRVIHEYRAWYRLTVWAGPAGLRVRQLQRQPLCEVHLARAEIVAADTVNHRVRVSDGRDEAARWALFVDPGNHQSVCTHCHASAIQAEERAADKARG